MPKVPTAAQLADIERFIGRADITVLEHYRQVGHDLPDEILQEREQEYYETARAALTRFDGLAEVLADLRALKAPVFTSCSK